jgi:hypothetical protein
MLVKVNAFPEHIHVSTVHMTQSTFVQGGPERSIIIYVHRPANLYRFVWANPFPFIIDGEDRNFTFVDHC